MSDNENRYPTGVTVGFENGEPVRFEANCPECGTELRALPHDDGFLFVAVNVPAHIDVHLTKMQAKALRDVLTQWVGDE